MARTEEIKEYRKVLYEMVDLLFPNVWEKEATFKYTLTDINGHRKKGTYGFEEFNTPESRACGISKILSLQHAYMDIPIEEIRRVIQSVKTGERLDPPVIMAKNKRQLTAATAIACNFCDGPAALQFDGETFKIVGKYCRHAEILEVNYKFECTSGKIVLTRGDPIRYQLPMSSDMYTPLGMSKMVLLRAQKGVIWSTKNDNHPSLALEGGVYSLGNYEDYEGEVDRDDIIAKYPECYSGYGVSISDLDTWNEKAEYIDPLNPDCPITVVEIPKGVYTVTQEIGSEVEPNSKTILTFKLDMVSNG